MSNGGQRTRERQAPEAAPQVFAHTETLTHTLPNGNQINYQIGSDTVDVRDARGLLKALINEPSRVSVRQVVGDREVELNDIQKHRLGEMLGERDGSFASGSGRVELAGAPEITAVPTEEVAAERQQARWVTIRSREYITARGYSEESQPVYFSLQVNMNALTAEQRRELGVGSEGGNCSLSSRELRSWSDRNLALARNRTQH